MPIYSPLIFMAQAEDTTAATSTTTATGTPVAAPVAPAKPGMFDPSTLVVIAIVMLAFMFFIQRPEKKRQEERLKALEGLKKGDKVISGSGIHGVVSRTNKGKDTVFVTVAKDVELEFSRTVLTVYTEPDKKDEPKKGEIEVTAEPKSDESRKKVKA